MNKERFILEAFSTFKECLKYLDSKNFMKDLNEGGISLGGNFDITISHDSNTLQYTVFIDYEVK